MGFLTFTIIVWVHQDDPEISEWCKIGPKTPNRVAEQALGHGIADPHNLQLRNPFHGCSALSFVAWLEVGLFPEVRISSADSSLMVDGE